MFLKKFGIKLWGITTVIYQVEPPLPRLDLDYFMLFCNTFEDIWVFDDFVILFQSNPVKDNGKDCAGSWIHNEPRPPMNNYKSDGVKDQKQFALLCLRTCENTDARACPHGHLPHSFSFVWSLLQGHKGQLRTNSLLQQKEWPYCAIQPKCRRPNNSHRCDLSITYMESVCAVPPTYMGSKLFGVPLIIMEVEGSKDVWGLIEQENKVMQEVTSSLTLIPECFPVFIHPCTISIWQAMCNAVRNAVEIHLAEIHLNGMQRSLDDALEYFLNRIIEILVKQMSRSTVIADMVIPFIRNKHQATATHHSWYQNMGPCCDDCYILDMMRSVSALKAGYPNTQFYWEDGAIPGSTPPRQNRLCWARFECCSWQHCSQSWCKFWVVQKDFWWSCSRVDM